MIRYTITARAESLGAGWKVDVFEDGEHISGGVFPAGQEGYEEALYFAKCFFSEIQ